jgi:hypothetical protein
MSVFIIEVSDDKQGVIYPTVYGPFDDPEKAELFAEINSLGTSAQDGAGGYSAYHIIGDGCGATEPVLNLDYAPEDPEDRQEYLEKVRIIFGDEEAADVAQQLAESDAENEAYETEVQRRLDAGEGVPSEHTCVCGCGIYHHRDTRLPQKPGRASIRTRQGSVFEYEASIPLMKPEDAGACRIKAHQCEKFEGAPEIPYQAMTQWRIERAGIAAADKALEETGAEAIVAERARLRPSR